MRTSDPAALLVALLLVGLAPAPENGAQAQAQPVEVREAKPRYRSAREALRIGVRDYNLGDKAGAVLALDYAAGQGDALARWKLGRMYAEGDGVPADDLRAFAYFSQIADDNADESPDSPNAGVVASAFVALGRYYVGGIPNSAVQPDPERARDLFHYAASYFGDARAQHGLGRLYLDGIGVQRDERQAARWFHLAAEKGHTAAQAILGQMLLEGRGVPRAQARGLMWLTMARDASDPAKDRWVLDLYDEAFRATSEIDRRAAYAQLESFLRTRR